MAAPEGGAEITPPLLSSATAYQSSCQLCCWRGASHLPELDAAALHGVCLQSAAPSRRQPGAGCSDSVPHRQLSLELSWEYAQQLLH